MSDALIVPANERGVVRVFSVKIEAGGVKAFEAPGAMDAALGVSGLDTEYVEVFPVSDLAGVGLATYLVDGCGVPAAVIEPDRARLEGIDGHVMVVLSRAFGGAAAELEPAAQLHLTGHYAQTPVDWSDSGPIRTESALPGSGRVRSPRVHRIRTRWIGASVFAIFIALVVMIIALIVF